MPFEVVEFSEADDLVGLYRAAFPDEDLTFLVRALLALGPGEGVFSLAIEDDQGAAGHVVVTRCGVDDAATRVALLGPLCVRPDGQGQGIGRALVEAARMAALADGAASLLVLGDPAIYGRFGFSVERAILPPYALPAAWHEAWQALALKAGARPAGRLRVPEPWRDPVLWK